MSSDIHGVHIGLQTLGSLLDLQVFNVAKPKRLPVERLDCRLDGVDRNGEQLSTKFKLKLRFPFRRIFGKLIKKLFSRLVHRRNRSFAVFFKLTEHAVASNAK